MAKTTVKVRKKQWAMFNGECQAASLRRDDFLSRLLPGEISMLDAIPACDSAGEQWLKRNWLGWRGSRDTELVAVPILLDDQVLKSMTSVCIEKKIPRDAFFDCVLYYDAANVIKDLRSFKDLAARLVYQKNQEYDGISERERSEFIIEELDEWSKGMDLDCFKEDYYKDRLSFDEARVERQNNLLEMALMFDNEKLKVSKGNKNNGDVTK
jgi:hypothetical protein